MTLTQEIILQIIAEIDRIRLAIKNKSLSKYALDQLIQRQEKLQEKLNELLQKNNVLTPTEADKLYEELRLKKERSLTEKLGKGYTAFIIFGALLVGGLYFAFRKPKNK